MSTDSSTGKPRYEVQEVHRSSPALFAQEVLGITSLWSKQKEVLDALGSHARVAVKSGNGLGKGFSAAISILWFLYCEDEAVVLSTAPTFRQVRHVLWKEVHRLHHRARYKLDGKLLDTRLEISESRYALGLSSDSADEFQGFHGPNMLIVVDEAEGVEETIYEAIESVMTSENCKLLLIGNPTTMAGNFRRAFYEDRVLYHTITISALESPNVLKGHSVIRGLVTRKWVEERGKIWGEENPVYQARVLGEFPDQGEDTLIPLSVVEGAAARNSTQPRGLPSQDGEKVVIAVDVARFGSDKSVILRRRGMAVEDIQGYRGLDTMKLAGHVAKAIELHQPDAVMIDEVGIGAGVVDRLREQGYHVQGVNVGTAAHDSEHYANLRAEGYWNLHDLFLQEEVTIPPDGELVAQLAGLRYTFNSLGRMVMESKEEIRRRGGASPDKADAMMLAFLSNRRSVRLWG